ncbi:Dirigent protein 2, partial [Linum grandiflorum]
NPPPFLLPRHHNRPTNPIRIRTQPRNRRQDQLHHRLRLAGHGRRPSDIGARAQLHAGRECSRDVRERFPYRVCFPHDDEFRIHRRGRVQREHGSTISLYGRNAIFDDVREMPVVGGTGVFRFARGYAEARTYKVDTVKFNVVVEYDVYVSHYF